MAERWDDDESDGDFDPTSAEYDRDPPPEDEELPLANAIYLLAVVFVHKIGRTSNGHRMARVKCEAIARIKLDREANAIEAIDPSYAGKVMWETIFLSPKTRWKLARLCRAMGYTEKWNPNDDDQVREVLLGRPFAVGVTPGKARPPYKPKLEFHPQRFIPAEMLTGEAQVLIDAWVDKWVERQEKEAFERQQRGGGGGGGGKGDDAWKSGFGDPYGGDGGDDFADD